MPFQLSLFRGADTKRRFLVFLIIAIVSGHHTLPVQKSTR
jgi:hypothetical protein